MRIARSFFAIGIGAFGIMQFFVGDFVAGRAPAWPEPMPGRLIWAYGSGAVLIACAAAIIAEKKARAAAIVAGTMIFSWAFLRHLPLTAADTFLSGQWTSAGKALVLFGGAFAVAGTLPEEKGSGSFIAVINLKDRFLRLGAICLGLFMILCGIQHFTYDEFVATLVPSWIPGAFFWTYFAGVALIAGGVGLIVPSTTRLAAALSGLMIFSWVWLVHVPRSFNAAYDSRNEWTSTFEALALSGLAFLLWQALQSRETARVTDRRPNEAGEPATLP